MSIDIYANALVECTNLKRVGIGSGKFNFIKLLKISPEPRDKQNYFEDNSHPSQL